MFFLGKRNWARSHNQVVIVHCLVELFFAFCILECKITWENVKKRLMEKNR